MSAASPPVVRKMLTQIEEVRTDGGPPLETPLLRGAILAVAENPFAGRYEPDIAPWMEALRPLGLEMAGALIAALGGDPGRVEGYGKGAIVGAAGELEHGALWHVPGGYAMRELLGGADGRARAIVPSTKKLGGVGCRLDVPITHVTASYVRSHFDSVEVGAPDGPGPNEIVFALAMTTGPRPHARVGGLAAADVKGEDGLR